MTRKASSWPSPAELRREGSFACLDFVNSEWTDWRGGGASTDRIADPEWWSRFLARWRLDGGGLTAPRGARLDSLMQIRRVMRRSIEKRRLPSPADLAGLTRRLSNVSHRWALSARSNGVEYRIVPRRPDWDAVTAALILSFSQLLNASDLSRLKRCANPDCTYVFYDESTNLSRRWCFSNVCGNMMHVRAFRSRTSA